MGSNFINENVQRWRQLGREGTLTIEEARAAVNAIRKERVEATQVSAASKTRKAAVEAKKAPIDARRCSTD